MQSHDEEKDTPFYQAGVKMKMGIKGTLEFRDKDGNIIKTVDMEGSVPLGEKDGTDNRG